jgi:hypothetical protein
LSRAPSALARDELIAVVDSTHDERLHDSTGGNRASKLFEGRFAEARTRLIWARVDQVDIDVIEPVTLRT